MSWSNYLYNKKEELAIEIGHFDNNNACENGWSDFEEFMEYMNNEEHPNLEVMKYLWNKTYTTNAIDLMINIFMEYIQKDEWELITEEELGKLKNVKVLNRS